MVRVMSISTSANQQIKRIGESPTLTAEQKKLQIMKYNFMRNRAAENIFGTRPVVTPGPDQQPSP